MPTQIQRSLISRHVAALDSVLQMTPQNDMPSAEQAVTAVSKMLLALPSREAGDLVAEAKSEAYMAAIEDVPAWATQEAIRRWYRGEYGPSHDYRWQPAPATLRDRALAEVYRVMGTKRSLESVLQAEPLVVFSEEHCAAMRSKIGALVGPNMAQEAHGGRSYPMQGERQ